MLAIALTTIHRHQQLLIVSAAWHGRQQQQAHQKHNSGAAASSVYNWKQRLLSQVFIITGRPAMYSRMLIFKQSFDCGHLEALCRFAKATSFLCLVR
jgi:hypothetical protein